MTLFTPSGTIIILVSQHCKIKTLWVVWEFSCDLLVFTHVPPADLKLAVQLRVDSLDSSPFIHSLPNAGITDLSHHIGLCVNSFFLKNFRNFWVTGSHVYLWSQHPGVRGKENLYKFKANHSKTVSTSSTKIKIYRSINFQFCLSYQYYIIGINYNSKCSYETQTH